MSNSKNSLYPQVDQSNPEAISSSTTPPPSIYPSVDMKDLAENLFPDNEDPQNPDNSQSQPPPAFESSEEILITVPGTVVHLIDKQRSVELASGELSVVRLRQGENVVAVFARVGEEIQWPLAKDEASVKLDESHYFFTLRVPPDVKSDEDEDDDDVVVQGSSETDENLLNYGVTIASKGQEGLLDAFDSILDHYSSFSVQKVAEAVDGAVAARETTPEEMATEVDKREKVEGSATAYWTTLAPNVEDYSGGVAKMIAAGSGHLIWGILWCGDVTVDRLKWGHDFMKKRLEPGSNAEISPFVKKRIRRVRRMTKRSEKVVTGILSGVLKVSGFFTSSIANSTVGKKFFSLLPGEIVLASLDGFNKVFDAVEVTGRNVMSTSSVVTTGLVSHRYGEQAGKVTNEGLEAAGYGIGTAWAVWKIRKAFNPKSVIKPTTIARAAAKENAAKSKTKLIK
ncbi:protein EARLY-RESPONSIVE TO DEHYDRATION 7, chloroplastic-like [Rhododendron vialii]|uniref:protein EARLY-RESPONSIVE TO DEHYDRATION 7, chloroplastic-like n=1 Tax=Rhododendron vialii TaxID=182163 RepID=UPI00265FE011|nr:protein EARLY-RESPONSIVE TO DEHYDRATION 7, chloroplastic-like [Rhododendron vialii]